MWLAGGFPKFSILDSIVFEGVGLLIPPECVVCFYQAGMYSVDEK